jgi:hypothetical protein
MDNSLCELVSIQNKILLQHIADAIYDTDKEKAMFINKYNKKNYTYIKIIKNDNIIKENNDKYNYLFRK